MSLRKKCAAIVHCTIVNDRQAHFTGLNAFQIAAR